MKHCLCNYEINVGKKNHIRSVISFFQKLVVSVVVLIFVLLLHICPFQDNRMAEEVETGYWLAICFPT